MMNKRYWNSRGFAAFRLMTGLLFVMAVMAFVALPMARAAVRDNSTGTGIPANLPTTVALSNTIDFSTNNAAQNDVIIALNIPADTFVSEVILEVVTVEGGTLTVDVGDCTAAGVAVDVDGWLDGFSCNTTTTLVGYSRTITVNTSTGAVVGPAYYAGKLYTSAGYIAVLANNAADVAVVKVTAICTPVL